MEPEINPTEEALLMQSIEQNDKLDEIAKTNEASVLEQASTTEAIKELTPALEAILIKLDEVASRDTQKVELVGPQITAIKGDKGDKGNTPTTEELEGLIKPLLPTTDDLLDIIEPLIPEPIKGDDGEDYILTENDKKEIASFIEVPIVEKVIEKTVIEKPVTIDKTKTVIKEVAKYESADDIVAKLNTLKKAIDFSVIKNFPDKHAYFGGNTQGTGISNITGFIIDGTNTTVSGTGTLADPYAINATGGGSPALTQNYVGFGDASNLLTGDASFQYLIDTHSLQFGESSIALISASNRGAFAHGYAVGDGFGIFASSDGSSASGCADEATISATSNGAFVNGFSFSNGSLIADGDGSTTFGIAGSYGVINSNGAGSLAFGSSSNIGIVQASGEASFAHGFVDFDGSSIVSSGTGSTASGYATNEFSIMAIGNGSLAGGYTDNGGVSVTGNGAFGWGDKLIVDGDFATAFGNSVTNTTANSFLIGYGGGTGLFVNNSNNVGIGTTAPAYKLQLSSNFAADDGFAMTDTDGGYFRIVQSTGTAGAFQPIIQGYATGNTSSMIFKGLQTTTGSPTAAVTRFISRASDDSSAVNAATNAFTFENGTTTVMAIKGLSVGIGDTSPSTNASRLSIVGGTGTTGIPFQYLSGTLSTTGSGTGAQYLITSPATAGTYSHAGLRVEFLAGYTGTGATRAFYSDNQVAGTGSDLRWNTSYSSPAGNSGGNMWASATTTGTNVGNFAEAKGGNVNVGLFGKAAAVKNSATNIGVIGHGRNTGTSPIQVGGWFSLANTAPTFVSAALVADNGDQTSPIFLARDNSTTVFSIIDGGNVGIGTTNPLAPIELRATRATIAFESSGLTGNMPFTDTASLGAWASTSYIGAINQMSQANGGLAFQGFTNSASLSAFALAGHVGSTTPTAAAVTISGWKSNGTTGRTAMTGAEKLLDITPGLGTAVFTLTAGGALGLGDNTPATNAKSLSIVSGTLTDLIPGMKYTATMPTTMTGNNFAINYEITGAGSSNFINTAFNVDYIAGYTGANRTVAGRFVNRNLGTGTGLIAVTGNIGAQTATVGVTTGTNVGFFGQSGGGNISVGAFGLTNTTKNSATNIGVLGLSINAGTSPIQVGGFFGLYGTDPTFNVSSALIADNGGTTSPIFLGRDNGTTTFTIADGGVVTSVQDIQVTNAGTTATSVLTTQGVQTITNKTITASSNVLGGVTMTIGSDADGDTYYRSSNVLTRLPKGTAGQVLTMNTGATAPEWKTPTGGSGSSSVQMWTQNFALSASTTRYQSAFLISSVEADTNMVVPRSGTIKNFYIMTSDGQPASGSLVFTLRKNGADTSIVITIAAGSAAGTYSDTSNTVSITAGDVITMQIVNNATSTAARYRFMTYEFE